MENNNAADFEKYAARLEEIAAFLEKGNLSLSEAVELYTEGRGLSARCSEILEKARLAVTYNDEDVKEDENND